MADTVLHLAAIAVLGWRAAEAARARSPLVVLLGVALAFVVHDLLT